MPRLEYTRSKPLRLDQEKIKSGKFAWTGTTEHPWRWQSNVVRCMERMGSAHLRTQIETEQKRCKQKQHNQHAGALIQFRFLLLFQRTTSRCKLKKLYRISWISRSCGFRGMGPTSQ